MPGAKAADLAQLAEFGIVAVMQAEQLFASIGVHLKVSLDIDVATLKELPLADIMHAQRPGLSNWPGMIIDIEESQIATDMALAQALDAKVAPLKIKLAIDNAGRSHAELIKAAAMPFVEFKLASDVCRQLRNRCRQRADLPDRDRAGAQAWRDGAGPRRDQGCRSAGAEQHGLRLWPGPPARPADAGGTLPVAVAAASGEGASAAATGACRKQRPA